MGDSKLQLAHPPIVEAVVDIDCDLSATQDLSALEAPALARFKDSYPKVTRQWLQEYRIEPAPYGAPAPHEGRHAVQALRFHQEGDRQLVQVRAQGYSFNRLSPYTALDEYLPEIERTWLSYLEIAAPIQVRQIRLRYINRILIPIPLGQVSWMTT